MSERINPYNLFVGSFIPNWLLARKEIAPGSKLVYARLAQFAGKNGQAFPKITTIAHEIGLSDRAVDRAIAELKEAGLIEVERRGLTRPNSYFFLRHKWMNANLDTSSTVSPDTPSTSSQDTPSTSSLLRESEEENHLRDHAARGTDKDSEDLETRRRAGKSALDAILEQLPNGQRQTHH